LYFVVFTSVSRVLAAAFGFGFGLLLGCSTREHFLIRFCCIFYHVECVCVSGDYACRFFLFCATGTASSASSSGFSNYFPLFPIFFGFFFLIISAAHALAESHPRHP